MKVPPETETHSPQNFAPPKRDEVNWLKIDAHGAFGSLKFVS